MKNNNGIFLFILAILLLAGMVSMTILTYRALPKKPVDKAEQGRYDRRIDRHTESRKWMI